MTRLLYRALLWLHPPAFRRQFAEEMLWIFDQAAAAEGARTLFADALISLARQWLLRSGSWKLAAALAGALLQITLVSFGMLGFGKARISAQVAGSTPDIPISMLSLIRLTSWLVAGILLTVLLTVLWFKKVGLCSNSDTSRNATRRLPPSRM
jgi:hypothetical protein